MLGSISGIFRDSQNLSKGVSPPLRYPVHPTLKDYFIFKA